VCKGRKISGSGGVGRLWECGSDEREVKVYRMGSGIRYGRKLVGNAEEEEEEREEEDDDRGAG
jgi:hypothetical protein